MPPLASSPPVGLLRHIGDTTPCPYYRLPLIRANELDVDALLESWPDWLRLVETLGMVEIVETLEFPKVVSLYVRTGESLQRQRVDPGGCVLFDRDVFTLRTLYRTQLEGPDDDGVWVYRHRADPPVATAPAKLFRYNPNSHRITDGNRPVVINTDRNILELLDRVSTRLDRTATTLRDVCATLPATTSGKITE